MRYEVRKTGEYGGRLVRAIVLRADTASVAMGVAILIGGSARDTERDTIWTANSQAWLPCYHNVSVEEIDLSNEQIGVTA